MGRDKIDLTTSSSKVKGKERSIHLLMEAFDTFKKASTTLESYYRSLEERIKKLNLELEEKNNYLTGILEGLPVGVLVTDRRGRIELANKEASSILGRRDLHRKEVCEIITLPFPLKEWSASGLKRPGKGEEIEVRGEDGKKRTLLVTLTVLANLKGETVGHLLVLNDITELKRLREQVAREKRLAAMGEMAASIAHQIRNPLGSMELFASLLKEEPPPEERARFTEEILKAIRRLNNTLSNMLLFANSSRVFKETVTVRELVWSVVEGCRVFLMGKDVELKTLLEVEDALILVDRELMKQALVNLVVNSIEAVGEREGGVVTIRTKMENDGLHILVSDNGKGIRKVDLERVFDPFFTTKPKGTGLGLTVVNNIVKAHGGLIDVESEEGKGTTFDITLREVMSHAQGPCCR